MSSDATRQQMVSQQVRTWDVLNPRVLDAMRTIDRQHFVPAAYARVAYADSRIPLPEGQVMLTPKVVGRLLQAVAPSPSDAVLEVGTGSGYLTACLAALAGHVTSIDIHGALIEHATAALAAAGADTRGVTLSTADVFDYTPAARFDAIVITGSLPRYDQRFERWLKPSGRLYVVIGEPPVMDATLVTPVGPDAWHRESLFETDVPPLENAPAARHFEF